MPNRQPHVTRFLTTGLPRAGTNLIHHSLADHPEVLPYNEIFNRDAVLLGSEAMDAEMGDTLREFRDTRPLAFIEYILNSGLPGIRAVGFKLFYMQGASEEPEKFELVWPCLRGMKGLKVLDVVRENRLEQAISWIAARRSNVWFRHSADPAPPQPFPVTCDELAGYFAWFDRIFQTRAALLQGMDVLQVRYEDLAADFTGQMVPIQEYLGVSVRRMPPRTVRQRTLPISQALANYAELREYFAGTPHFRYFEMAEENTRRLAAAT